jgi:predicted nucleotidyltransferase
MNEEIKTKISKAAEALKSCGAKEVFVFGSAANGNLGKHSDIDLAVSGLPPERFIQALGDAREILDLPVDLVDLDEDNPFARYLKDEGELVSVA